MMMRSSNPISGSSTTSSSSSSLVRWRFTRRFLGELRRIANSCSSQSTSTSTTRGSTAPACNKEKMVLQRYVRVKSAAEKSLASAVGKRRVWSRAVLARNMRGRRRTIVPRRRKRCTTSIRRRTRGRKKRSPLLLLDEEEAAELRKLMPGGEGMLEVNGLLEEAAHYIKCLHTQVQVMSSLANLLSAAHS